MPKFVVSQAPNLSHRNRSVPLIGPRRKFVRPRPNQGLWTIFYLGAFAFLVFWAIGALLLWMQPPNEMAQKCIGKTAAELARCIYDYADDDFLRQFSPKTRDAIKNYRASH